MLNKIFRRGKSATALLPGDAVFMNDVKESLLAQTTPGSRLIIQLIAAVLVGALVWAYFARVEEITVAEAKVIPKSREQIIQSLEGGILAQMSVQEGDIVEKGQVLLKIDATRAQSSYQEVLSKVIGLKASITRLKAEAYGAELAFDDLVKTDPAVVQQERQAYKARKNALDESVSALRRSYELSEREIKLAEPLAAKGLMSEVELLRMKRQTNEIKTQIVERTNRYQAEANAELARFELELSQTSANMVGRADVVERTTVLAPVRGTIKNVQINNPGMVIQPGEKILEIIPLEDQLLVEGKVKPADVAFLHPGLPATVKITAYDYSIYGGLKGRVTHISPDTLKDDKKTAAGRADDTYYRVLILTDSNSLQAGGKSLPIIPGMVASAEVRTGEKTILNFLLKPVLKAREAFRER